MEYDNVTRTDELLDAMDGRGVFARMGESHSVLKRYIRISRHAVDHFYFVHNAFREKINYIIEKFIAKVIKVIYSFRFVVDWTKLHRYIDFMTASHNVTNAVLIGIHAIVDRHLQSLEFDKLVLNIQLFSKHTCENDEENNTFRYNDIQNLKLYFSTFKKNITLESWLDDMNKHAHAIHTLKMDVADDRSGSLHGVIVTMRCYITVNVILALIYPVVSYFVWAPLCCCLQVGGYHLLKFNSLESAI